MLILLKFNALLLLFSSENWHDELTAASAWMFKVTGEDKYLQTAKDVRGGYIPDGMDWSSKGAGANVSRNSVFYSKRPEAYIKLVYLNTGI